MEKIINDFYDDKYTRAAVIYAIDVEGSLKASYNVPSETIEAQFVPSDKLLDYAKKGLIVVIGEKFYNPVAFEEGKVVILVSGVAKEVAAVD